jgi:hypothetical protein
MKKTNKNDIQRERKLRTWQEKTKKKERSKTEP